VVLTAGHCVDTPEPKLYKVVVGDAISGDSPRLEVVEALRHPQFDLGQIKYDLALLRLEEGAAGAVMPIAPLPRSLAVDPLDLGKPFEYVGFGMSSEGTVGKKLAVTDALQWICPDQEAHCAIGEKMWASPNTLCTDQSPGGPCRGDSGGALLLRRKDTEYVAGVISYGDEACQKFGCNTKVDAFEAFIDAFVAGEQGSFCESDAECQSGYCAQGVCCESACDGGCRSCRLPGSLGLCRTVPDSTPCPDNDACNGDETCQQGVCQPALSRNCDDGNSCTADRCDPRLGCLHDNRPDGESCGNDNPCDGEELCQAGVCVAGVGLEDGTACGICAQCQASARVEIFPCQMKGSVPQMSCAATGLATEDRGLWPSALALIALFLLRRKIPGTTPIKQERPG